MKITLALIYFVHYFFGLDGVTRILRKGLSSGSEVTAVLRRYNAKVATGSVLESCLTIHGAQTDFSNLSIDSGAHIGKEVFFDLTDRIKIGACATISMRTMILTHIDVGKSSLASVYPRCTTPVIIEEGAYIGAGATILSGITVGRESVIAAGAVVIHDVPAHSVVAGIPARVVKLLPVSASK